MSTSEDKSSNTSSNQGLDNFREAMGDVRPLKKNRAEPHLARPKADPKFSRQGEQEVMKDALYDPIDIEQVESGEELLFYRPGIQHSTFKKLRRGQFIVEYELDLHGYTSNQARVEVSTFLYESRHMGARCVRIIHGKGNGSAHRGPVLKNKVNAWLRQRDDVLAFSSAHPKDGGTGAVYVLLSRK